MLDRKLPGKLPESNLEMVDMSMGWFDLPAHYFSQLAGVEAVIAGYTGGKYGNPTFTNKVDHVEAIRVIYNATVITYEEILEHFLEQVGLPDSAKCRGEYRPSIFAHNDYQFATATRFARILERARSSAVPKIYTAMDFYRAEENLAKWPPLKFHDSEVSVRMKSYVRVA